MLNAFVKKLIRDFIEGFVTQDLVLRILNGMFDLLRQGAGRIPGEWDDAALASFESSINKAELSAKIQQWLLDMILPALQTTVAASDAGITVAEIEAEAKVVLAEVAAKLQP
jgi:hypothetical protein